MKRSKFSEAQIVYAIRQAEVGTPVGDLCLQFVVSDATFYAWKKMGCRWFPSYCQALMSPPTSAIMSNCQTRPLPLRPVKRSLSRIPCRANPMVTPRTHGYERSGWHAGGR